MKLSFQTFMAVTAIIAGTGSGRPSSSKVSKNSKNRPTPIPTRSPVDGPPTPPPPPPTPPSRPPPSPTLPPTLKYSTYSIAPLLPESLIVFDNKSSRDGTTPEDPRIGISRYGSYEVVMEGNSPVLTMADLESVSLLRRDEGWYCAVDSFGAMVVFQLVRNMETGALMANTVATISNDGQLPVPEGEVFDGEKPWESPNRTNIEATRYFATPPAFLREVFPVFAEQEPIMVWGARGGRNYAGKATQDTVWVRAAPFDITTCSVDETLMVEFELPNLGETENWRALSDLDADDEHMYFTAAYDAEEDGLGFAFQSLVGRTNLIEEAEIIAAYEGGVKLEGLMVAPALLDKNIKSRSLLIASDDEGLGSLIGALNIDDVASDVLFRDFGNILSRRYPELSTKRLGASGLAELAFVEAASPNLGVIFMF